MQIIVKKALQGLKNRKNIPAEKVAAVEAAEAAEKEEHCLIAAESLVSEVRRLVDCSVTLVALAGRSAAALEALQGHYEAIVSYSTPASSSLLTGFSTRMRSILPPLLL